MSKHTPTPWTATKARTLIHITGNSGVCSISISANHVHEDYAGRKAEYIAQQEANAAFIVLAVNSHDALVEALAGMVDMYTSLINSGDAGNWDPEKGAQVIAARAALALVSP